jgi:hypothetical protein
MEDQQMDAHRLDAVARRFARSPLSRRMTIRTGGLGLLGLATGVFRQRSETSAEALAAPPTIQSTPGATPTAETPDAMLIDGAWFCNQTFALCTTAPCEPSQSDPSVVNCHCVVVDSYAIGFKTCPERAQAGSSLHSNFSTVNVNSEFRVLTCPESAPWANCLDVPCEIDGFNPAVATCQCELVETGPSLTFGGGCDTSTCTATILSAAPEGLLGLAQFEEGMKRVNQTVTLPATCPSATPVASPIATPAGG